MSEVLYGGVDFATKGTLDAMDRAMQKANVPEQTRKLLITVFERSIEYVTFCIQHGQKPDKRALAEFLSKQTTYLAKMSQIESMECFSAMADVAINLRNKVALSKGGPVGVTLAGALLTLEVLEVGNSCSFAQEWYYNTFLRGPVSKPARDAALPILLNGLDSAAITLP